jgi:hypothetical protein
MGATRGPALGKNSGSVTERTAREKGKVENGEKSTVKIFIICTLISVIAKENEPNCSGYRIPAK